VSVSIIIPTRQRLDRLLHTITSLRDAGATGLTELVIVVDNDPEIYDYLKAKHLADILIYNTERLEAVASWNTGAAMANGDYLFTGADDIIFKPGWLDRALEAMQSRNYGVVAINDMHNGPDGPATHVLINRQFSRDHLGGVLWCPHYVHYFIDTEVKIRAATIGRFHWCKEAIVEHQHPAAGKAKNDSLYQESQKWWEQDERTFNERQKAGWPDDYEAIL